MKNKLNQLIILYFAPEHCEKITNKESFHVVPMQEIQQVVPTDIMTLKILGQRKALGDCETIESIRSRAANLQFRLTFTGERPGAGTARTLVAAFHQRDAQRSTARGEAPNEAEDEGEDAD